MSKTQMNLNNYVCLLLTAGISSACSDATYKEALEYCLETYGEECVESTYCTQVYNADCPSAENFERQYLPSETCDGLEHVKAVSEATSSEITMDSGDTGSVSESSSYTCCYDTVAATVGTLCGETPPAPTEGRPLIFEGVAQAASISLGKAWSKGPLAESSLLTLKQRQVLSTFWLKTAQMEHASVASFHQFALDLMRFGASPELLIRTNKAILDEVAHAKAAFAITEGLLGQPVSPSEFHMNIQPTVNVSDFATKVALEGAINETIAVVLASLQRAKCTDFAIQQFLSDVIREEAEHAELAWDTLRWLVTKGGQDVIDSLRRLLAIDYTPDVSAFPVVGIPSHGLPSQTVAFAVLKNAYEHVVIPNLKLILEEHITQLAVS